MRAYVFSDTLRRTLRFKGYDVRHVMNITDVGHLTSDADEGDDKLEAAARRESRNIWEIAEHYTRAFKEDLAALRILEPDVWCKATDHIEPMVTFAEGLDVHGWCYPLPSGLYFDTSKDDDYGALARLDLAGQQEGARVELVEGKRNPSDFAVWRTSAPGENRQMEWDSPWGRGAPGWHLECSVMSMQYLGEHFDIHTGGVDHIPVHHTNEIAQSEAFLDDGQPWVAWWLHGEFINLKNAKISKSSGDSLRATELQGFHPLVYRYLLLQAHYRSQVEFSWDAMESARTGLRRLLERCADVRGEVPDIRTYDDAASRLGARARSYLDSFDAAICADLNTSAALGWLSKAMGDAEVRRMDYPVLLAAFESVLGIGLTDLVAADMDITRDDADEDAIAALVAERDAARAAKDFARSDAIRDQLKELGVEVMDRPGEPSTWRFA